MTRWMALCAGLLFGTGLHVSGMTDVARVLGFLDLAGAWDPTLAFVMGGALLVTLPVFRWTTRGRRPWFAEDFRLPLADQVDRRLLTGAALFGIGWGLVGLCPGPALANLAGGDGDVLIFVLAMFAGMALHELAPRR